MQDDLVERCAEAAWQTESRRASGRDRLIPWAEEGPDGQEAWRDTARSIIPIVLEEAAQTCLEWDEFSPYNSRADAIRAKMENLT